MRPTKNQQNLKQTKQKYLFYHRFGANLPGWQRHYGMSFEKANSIVTLPLIRGSVSFFPINSINYTIILKIFSIYYGVIL
jgi:hypothetical protein